MDKKVPGTSLEAQSSDESRRGRSETHAGRGGLWVFVAKGFFIVIGFAQQVLLRRFIGDDGYGAFSRVMSASNIVNNVVVSSSIQGVSRVIARSTEKRAQAMRAVLFYHFPLAFLVGGSFAMVSPFIAQFHHAPRIATPLLIMAVVLTFYSFYAPLIGALNGRGQFSIQAILDMIYAILRTVGLMAGGYWFSRRGQSGVTGATLGIALASMFIFSLAFFAVFFGFKGQNHGRMAHVLNNADETSEEGQVPTWKNYLSFLVPLAFAQLCTNLLMQADLSLLGRFLSESAAQVGMDQAAKRADEWVAVYRYCQVFSFVPYQLLMSVTQVLFPMVARAHSEKKMSEVALFSERGARIATLVCGLMVSVLVAFPQGVLGLLLPSERALQGASTLRILALSQGLFCMFGIASTILSSIKRERLAALITFFTFLSVVFGVWVNGRRIAFGEPQLVRVAEVSLVCMSIGLAVMSYFVKKYAGSFIRLGTFTRTLVAVFGFFAFGKIGSAYGLHQSKGATLLGAVAVALVYVSFLVFSRELNSQDVDLIRSLRKKKEA